MKKIAPWLSLLDLLLYSFLWLSILFFSVNLSAQYTGSGSSGGQGAAGNQRRSLETDSEQEIEVRSEKINVKKLLPNDLEDIRPYTDTAIGLHFQQYDPARDRLYEYATLGNLGSAHQQLFFQPRFRQGFDDGFHQFDLYKVNADSLEFYEIERSFTDLFFTQGPTQSDVYFNGRFSRNFANGINYSLEYNRINNAGVYAYQQAKISALNTGFWWNAKGGRYDAFISYTDNVIRQEDNGGIDTSQINEQNTNNPIFVPINLDNQQAETRHDDRRFTFIHYWKLNKQDTSKSESELSQERSYRIKHRFQTQKRRIKFSDTSPAADSSYYGILQTNDQGLRHFIEYTMVENAFSLGTSKINQDDVEGKVKRDWLEAGLVHRFYDLYQEPRDSNFQTLFLTGNWLISPRDWMQLKIDGHFGILGNATDYRINGDLILDFPKAGRIHASLTNQRYTPSLVQERFFISKEATWNKSYDKPIETSLAISYQLPKINTRLSGQYHLINNFIYFDTSGIPQQSSTGINVGQLAITQPLKLGFFQYEGTVIFQAISEQSLLRLPEILTKHSLFFSGYIFKKSMLAHIGMDFRINTAFQSNTYQPLTGQFQQQDKNEVKAYPLLDAFFNLKIKHLRAYVKMENLASFWLPTDEFYFLTANYPYPNNVLKIGLAWQLLD